MRAMILVAALALAGLSASRPRNEWSKDELSMLRSLSLSSLGPVPADASNRYADDTAAAGLGHALFFDTRFSANGGVACATCHMPEKNFQDSRSLAQGVGTTGRRTMPIAGTAYSPWQFWDGRADSQWSQALGPLESAVEHAGNRAQYARLVAAQYSAEYRRVFGVPVQQHDISRIYANIGKAIEAYERRIMFAPSRFDRFVDTELAGRPHTPENDLSANERAGLRLFIGKANCANCHNGALFTDNHFHNTGVPQSAAGTPNDSGRATGVRAALSGEFNCLSKYSDAKPDDCAELQFAVTEGAELVRAFKTPSLRNVTTHAPYMHAGQLASLDAVLDHYNRAPSSPAGKSELKKLRLSATELRQIVDFLGTLSSPLSAPAGYMEAPRKNAR